MTYVVLAILALLFLTGLVWWVMLIVNAGLRLVRRR